MLTIYGQEGPAPGTWSLRYKEPVLLMLLRPVDTSAALRRTRPIATVSPYPSHPTVLLVHR